MRDLNNVHEIIRQYQEENNQKAFKQVFEYYSPIVAKEANRFTPAYSLDRDDNILFAEEGLWNAIKGFDPSETNKPFAPYAWRCIRNTLVSAYADAGKHNIIITLYDEDKALDEIWKSHMDTEGNTFVGMCDAEIAQQQAEYVLSKLSQTEREVVELRTGWGGNHKSMSITEIAQARGVTHEAIRKVLIRAEGKIINARNRMAA